MLGRSPPALERSKAEEPEKPKKKTREKEEYRQDVTHFSFPGSIIEATEERSLNVFSLPATRVFGNYWFNKDCMYLNSSKSG